MPHMSMTEQMTLASDNVCLGYFPQLWLDLALGK